MKKKHSFRNTALCMLLAVSLLGCAGGRNTPAVETEKTQTDAEPAAAVQEETERRIDPESPEKQETVWVTADASGGTEKISVETVLNYAGADGTVSDRTNLSGIKNTEGDEMYTLLDDGTLLWEDHGNVIRYKGESAQPLPVTVHVTYFLDGKEIQPDLLAGRSGHVTMRFDYENHTLTEETVFLQEEDDADPVRETAQVCVPFLAVTAVVLPEDTFSNIRLTNGRLVSMEGQNMAMGYALPGLEDSLRLEQLDMEDPPQIPSYFQIEADVTDFELDFTATVISNGIFSEDETEEKPSEMEKLPHAMEELADATDELEDAGREFSDGVRTFASYFDQYVSGIGKLTGGMHAMNEGLDALNTQKKALEQGAEALRNGLAQLCEAIPVPEEGEADETAAQAAQILEGLSLISGSLDSCGTYLEEVSADLQEAQTELENALQTIGEMDAEQQEQLSGVTVNIQTALDKILEADSAKCAETAQTLASLKEQVDTLQGLITALLQANDPAVLAETLNSLKTGAQQLYDGITALNRGIEQIHTASGQIEQGMSGINNAGPSMRSAVSALTGGADEFASALREYNEEAILELTDRFDGELRDVLVRFKGLRQSDRTYENFGGIEEGRTGSVRFIIETDSVKAE